MCTYQQIRFAVTRDAVDDVKTLIHDYARYIAEYAKKHNELWAWSTYQSINSPTDFVSVIVHQDAAAQIRHMESDGTNQFAENLYVHVTYNEQSAYRLIASSDA